MLQCSRCGRKDEGHEMRICKDCGYMMYPIEREISVKKTVKESLEDKGEK